jgi:hypothetical protein
VSASSDLWITPKYTHVCLNRGAGRDSRNCPGFDKVAAKISPENMEI